MRKLLSAALATALALSALAGCNVSASQTDAQQPVQATTLSATSTALKVPVRFRLSGRFG